MKEGRGAGHRPGYTIALAILSDAVALVRGTLDSRLDMSTHKSYRRSLLELRRLAQGSH